MVNYIISHNREIRDSLVYTKSSLNPYLYLFQAFYIFTNILKIQWFIRDTRYLDYQSIQSLYSVRIFVPAALSQNSLYRYSRDITHTEDTQSSDTISSSVIRVFIEGVYIEPPFPRSKIFVGHGDLNLYFQPLYITNLERNGSLERGFSQRRGCFSGPGR